MANESTAPRTVTMRVSWEFAVRGMIQLIRNPKASPDTVAYVERELLRLAEFADEENARREGMPRGPVHADLPLARFARIADAESLTRSDADPSTGIPYGELT